MQDAVDNFSIDKIKALFVQHKSQGLENDEFRHNLERCLRKKAITFGDPSVSVETIDKLLKFVVSIAKEELCTKFLTVNVMQDVFDVSDIKRCEHLFSIIEDNISIWKTNFFFEYCKNQILRMCNDLLKRLSRTVDTNFCGRILILLAKSLPLTEKSGLNLISQFNTANVTTYEEEKVRPTISLKKPASDSNSSSTLLLDERLIVTNHIEKEEKQDEEPTEEDHDMEIGEIRENNQDKDSSIPVDYTHYVKFWQLQEYFSNPLLCYEKAPSWKKFQHNLNEILNIFSTYKIDRANYKYDRDREKSVVSNVDTRSGSVDEEKILANGSLKNSSDMDWQTAIYEKDKDDAFFAKYLTNQKKEELFLTHQAIFGCIQKMAQELFQLQIADSQFRRYFLVQCLILTQYLTSDIKFRDATCLLDDEKKRFVMDVADRCYRILRETYPHGSHFSDSIKKILSREKLWSQWKNDGCPDVLKEIRGQKVQMFKKKPVTNYDSSKIDLGNPELTRLWNINPDIQSACKDPKRKFVPNVDRFVTSALEELDPEQEVDDEYKCVNNEGWQWRASRLLMFETDQYLTTCCYGAPAKASSAPTNAPKFLEEVIKNIATTNLELKNYGEKVFERIELKKQQDEEKASALALEKKKLEEEEAKKIADEQTKKPVERKISEENGTKRPLETSSKDDTIETNHEETTTPVTPVPPSPKKFKADRIVEVKHEGEERNDEQRKRKATVNSDDKHEKASPADREKSNGEGTSLTAAKKLKIDPKEHNKDVLSTLKPASFSAKQAAHPITDEEIKAISIHIADYRKLAEVLGIPSAFPVPKHRTADSVTKSLLDLWKKRMDDPAKATLTKLSMILATNEFLDENLSAVIKELQRNREKEKEKETKEKHSSSSSRRREEKR